MIVRKIGVSVEDHLHRERRGGSAVFIVKSQFILRCLQRRSLSDFKPKRVAL